MFVILFVHVKILIQLFVVDYLICSRYSPTHHLCQVSWSLGGSALVYTSFYISAVFVATLLASFWSYALIYKVLLYREFAKCFVIICAHWVCKLNHCLENNLLRYFENRCFTLKTDRLLYLANFKRWWAYCDENWL